MKKWFAGLLVLGIVVVVAGLCVANPRAEVLDDFFDDFEFEAWSITFFTDIQNTKYQYHLVEETPDGSNYSGRFYTNLPDDCIITWSRPVYIPEPFDEVRFELKRAKGAGGKIAVHFKDSAGNTFQSSVNYELDSLKEGWQVLVFDFTEDAVFGWGGRQYSEIRWPLVRMSFNVFSGAKDTELLINKIDVVYK